MIYLLLFAVISGITIFAFKAHEAKARLEEENLVLKAQNKYLREQLEIASKNISVDDAYNNLASDSVSAKGID